LKDIIKPYSQLTYQGKRRRLWELAELGLTHYDLNQPTLAFHSFDTNLLFRVTSASGEKFILRLACPGWRTLVDLQSEAIWLDALGRDTAIPVPGVIPTWAGAQVLSIAKIGIPHIWHMTLMRWVPGRLLGHYLTENNLEKMGVLFAQLHDHGAHWTPPQNFTKRRFEHWLSRGEQNLLSKIVRDTGDCDPSEVTLNLPGNARALLAGMDSEVESAFQAIDRSDLRVIHCDLWHDNIKLYQGRLHPFDFEDTVWGFRVHDIAMAMLDLLEDTDEVTYAKLLPAFKQGYESNLAWPEDPIEPFQIGRLLWKINWVARRQPANLLKFIEGYLPVFETYQRTGRITLPIFK
jgi:Ser/Thr protein kinase RdoA (MazF antagonist)